MTDTTPHIRGSSNLSRESVRGGAVGGLQNRV